MDKNNSNIIWIAAGGAGTLAFAIFILVTSYTFWPALILSLLIAILVAILVWIAFYRPSQDDAEAAVATPAQPEAPVEPDVEPASPEETVAETSAETPAETPDETPAQPKAKPAAVTKNASSARQKQQMRASSFMGDAGHRLKAKNVGDFQKPFSMTERLDGNTDDLKKIKGVGLKLEEKLHSMGFFHFEQIAGWKPGEVAWVDENLEGFTGRVARDNWVDQAKVLAEVGETEFSRKVDEGDVY